MVGCCWAEVSVYVEGRGEVGMVGWSGVIGVGISRFASSARTKEAVLPLQFAETQCVEPQAEFFVELYFRNNVKSVLLRC